MEPVMKNRYLVAKYISNLARMEPKNVGVFLHMDGRMQARFIGERNLSLDLRAVKSLVSHTGSYKQWVEYWRHLMSEPASGDEILNRLLATSNGNYIVTEGEVVFPPREFAGDSPRVLEYLFQLLVGEFPEQKESLEQVSLSAKCEEIIRHYGLKKTPHFEESPIISVDVDGITQHIKPSYRWLNGSEVYFQKVSLDGAKIESTQKDVNSALWMFEKLKDKDERVLDEGLGKDIRLFGDVVAARHRSERVFSFTATNLRPSSRCRRRAAGGLGVWRARS
jgi:hypothetical protein